MCHVTTCPRCRKATWSGCGQHADAVLRPYPPDQRCSCERQPRVGLLSRLRGGSRSAAG